MKSLFVSSTFKDMHYERDAIQNIVLPELRKFAAKYGESFTVTDLRWGIDTEDMDEVESSTKVLSVCLDEIKHCKPYFVVLMGNRYGWIPDSELLKKAISDSELELEDYEKSITALEIEYGALLENNPNAIFYFRELDLETIPEKERGNYQSESSHHEKILNELKERIKEKYPNQVRTYKAVWDQEFKELDVYRFSQLVIEDIKEQLTREFGQIQQIPWQKQLLNEMWSFAQSKSDTFKGRETELEKLDSLNSPVIEVTGEAGIGKTALIAEYATRKAKEDELVIPVFVPLSAECNSVDEILSFLIYNLDESEKAEVLDRLGKVKLLKELMEDYVNSKGKISIVIDGADLLDEDVVSLLESVIPEGAKIVTAFPESSNSKDRSQVEVTDLSDKDIKDIVITSFARNLHEIPQEAIEEILNKRWSSNPLYLSHMIKRLLSLTKSDYHIIQIRGDGIDNINDYLVEIIQEFPDSLDDFFYYSLGTITDAISTADCRRIVRAIACTRYGLRRDDLKRFLEFDGFYLDEINLALLLNLGDDVFFERSDGRIDILHPNIKEALVDNIMTYPRETYYKANIFDTLSNLPDSDPIKLREFYYQARILDLALEVINQIQIYSKTGTKDEKRVFAESIVDDILAGNLNWFLNLMDNINLQIIDQDFYKFVLDEIEPLLSFNDKKSSVLLLEKALKSFDRRNDDLELKEEFKKRLNKIRESQ